LRSIYRTIYKQTCLQLKKITTVFWFPLMQFDYEVWEIIIYFTTCFSFWSLFYTDFLQSLKNLERSWTIGQTGRIFFLLKTTQIWVITIVVVLVQSTVIFQKGDVCWSEKQHISILKVLVWTNQGSNPQSTTFKGSMPTVTPQRWFHKIKR
jgi:signal transduction histidine kinase